MRTDNPVGLTFRQGCIIMVRIVDTVTGIWKGHDDEKMADYRVTAQDATPFPLWIELSQCTALRISRN